MELRDLKIKDLQILNDQIERTLCQRSFFYFFKSFWSVINTEPLVANWHIEECCNQAQELLARVMRREKKEYDLIINIPPGTTKSTIFSQMLNAWAWTIDPSLRFLTGSHTSSLALSMSVKTRDILKSKKYQKLFPEVNLRKDLDAKSWYENTQGGARYTCSVDSSPVGKHAHVIVIDDPIDPQRAIAGIELDSVNEWFDGTLQTRKVDKAISAMILVMQRLNENDPSGYLLKKNPSNFRHICLPAELSNEVKPEELKKKYVNGLLDPIRLNQDILEDQKNALGLYNYAGQFSQIPTPKEGGMFVTSEFRIVKELPAEIMTVVRSWDKAGTEGGGCKTAGVKMAKLRDGSFIVLDCILGQWRADKREEIIKKTAKLDKVTTKIIIEQEGGSGGKESAENTVKNLSGFSVFVDRPKGNKALRAEPYSTQVNIGNVYLLEGPWNKDYMDELHYFPRGAFRDQVDASSQAFAYLNSKSRIDFEKLVKGLSGETSDKMEEEEFKDPEEKEYITLSNGIKIPLNK